MSVIEDAFERELALGDFIDMADVQRSLAKSQDQALDELRRQMMHRSLDDMHEAMAWWAMFREPAKPSSSSTQSTRDPADPGPARKTKSNAKATNKKRRKMAKASRKSQRRKKK